MERVRFSFSFGKEPSNELYFDDTKQLLIGYEKFKHRILCEFFEISEVLDENGMVVKREEKKIKLPLQ